ncbi:MAG: ribonuclease Z [Gemmatimonadota bacterium]|nr:MAG: ribonuclease Z [Gemmatimonadota bacterium]
MLFDCGEGTQRQMMRYQTGFSLDSIFFTHMHADHILGLPGLLRTMGLQGRTEPITLYGPVGSRGILAAAAGLGVDRDPFEVIIEELSIGDRVGREEYDMVALGVDHGAAALGYALAEHRRAGRFDVQAALALGIPEGPLFGRLHQGETIEVDGRTIEPHSVVGPDRDGRTVVYTGDTRPVTSIIEAAQNAELLIHEATFTEDERDRALSTFHSTAKDAAEVAALAGVRRLVLTHVSARYSDDPGAIKAEAREVFPGAVVAQDGLVIELPFSEDDDGANAVPEPEEKRVS